MHTETDEDYQRGYEWWLMEQAKARNPGIKLAALSWGAPGWIGSGTIWTTKMIGYVINWLAHAKADHGLTIDYIGGWNENGYNKAWFEQLKSELTNHNLTTQVIAADNDWAVVDDLVSDPAFRAAVDIVGVHYPCGGDGASADGCDTPSANALNLHMPLWASENGSQDYNGGADAMARAINRGYLDTKMTAFINWPLVAALPANLPFPTTGLLVADQPWSGHYAVGKSLWVTAHTTQFSQPGWSYLDSASGYLGGVRTAGSYVTLVSPNGPDFSIVVETTRAAAPRDVAFTIGGGLSTGAIQVWATNLASANPSDWFVQLPTLVPNQGVFWLTLQPDHLYSFTSTSGPGKGTAASPAAAPFALPYNDDFDGYAIGKEARYLADEEGAFETVSCGGGRSGVCVRQMAQLTPVYWHAHAGYPYTLIGDGTWTNYTVSADVLFEQPGSAELIGRFSARDYWEIGHIDAYYLKVTDGGAWSIVRGDTGGGFVTLTSGNVAALGIGTWHTLALTLQEFTLSASIDNASVGGVDDASYGAGPAGLAVGAGDTAFTNVQLDRLSIVGGSAPAAAYTLVNVHSGKLLATAGSGRGALIVQSTAAAGDTSQEWSLLPRDDAWELVNVGSSMALEDPGFISTAGKQLDQWTIDDGNNQRWKLSVANGVFTLTNVASGLVADVAGSGTTDGTPVIQWSATGGDNQQWRLVPVP
jgi:hypothetical protein